MRSPASHQRSQLRALAETRRCLVEDPALVVSFEERQRLVGKPMWDGLEGKYGG